MKICLSVIIPCRNEVHHLGQVLADLSSQDYSEPFEVIVADGMSEDGTRELLREQQASGRLPFPLQVVDNPNRHIPSGLNLAVAASSGALIVRIDGHSRIGPDYVHSISLALQGEAEVAGPRVEPVAGNDTITARMIALLLATKLGTGGTPSRHRLRAPVRVAHTVMSCYRRSVWTTLGGYDERLLSNEDFDFDWRANAAGFVVQSLPEPVFRLKARTTLGALAKQRWRYGFWKAAVLRSHPYSLQPRQVAPVIAPVLLLAVALAAPWAAVTLVLIYMGVAGLSGAHAAWQARWPILGVLTAGLRAPLIYGIIHGAWAAGLVAGGFYHRAVAPWPINGSASSPGMANP